MHLVTDGRGLPLVVEVTPGQRHESTRVEAVMNDIVKIRAANWQQLKRISR